MKNKGLKMARLERLERELQMEDELKNSSQLRKKMRILKNLEGETAVWT